MLPIEQKVRVIEGLGCDHIPQQVLQSSQPLLLKGVVSSWPVVAAARQSFQAASQYLGRFYRDATVGAFFGLPETRGRVFYNEDMSGFNFERVMLKLNEVIARIEQHRNDPTPPMIYVGSTTVENCLPGFRNENDVKFEFSGAGAGQQPGGIDPLASIWMGNRTQIAAHFDVPDNLACNVTGHRRFTLFPPEQLQNLYVGPLDFTPAGQAISMVDFDTPDYETHPRFKDALPHAQVAELEPGDAIFIPGMWWHHVQSQDAFNVLVNYWWRRAPDYMDSPLNVLNHALLSIRDLPAEQRQAWQEIFRHYVFDARPASFEHIPESRRGVLSPLDEREARRLRAQLLSKLNR